MADMKEVIERLIERTEERRVPWKVTDDDSLFAATIGDMSVMVSSERYPRRPGESPFSLKIAVLDEGWREISSFEVSRVTSREYQRLYALWQAAKASATGANTRLDEFLEALDAAPTVPLQEPARQRIGRLPFRGR